MPLVIDIPFDPVLARIGPLPLHWYGLGYAIAFLVGLRVAGRHVEARGVPPKVFGSLSFWAIVLGLVGARLFYDVQNGFGYYVTHPLHILATWEGGMAYYGAILAASGYLLVAAWRRRIDFWLVADGAALFAAAGQPIGRIGNIFNGDILGYPSSLPWAVAYTNPATLAPQVGVAYQPANAYELLVAAGIAAVLFYCRRRLEPPAGGLFLLYLWLYNVTQFLVFFLRANSVTAFGLKQAQLTSLVLMALLVPVTWWWWRHRADRPQVVAAPAPVEAA